MENYPYCEVFIGCGKIYSLSDAQGNVFYVGCTVSSLETRLKCHISEAKNRKVQSWAKNEIIRNSDYSITAKILEIVYVTATKSRYAPFKLRPYELKWINHLTSLGHKLCNRECRKPPTVEIKEHVGMELRISKGKIKVRAA